MKIVVLIQGLLIVNPSSKSKTRINVICLFLSIITEETVVTISFIIRELLKTLVVTLADNEMITFRKESGKRWYCQTN